MEVSELKGLLLRMPKALLNDPAALLIDPGAEEPLVRLVRDVVALKGRGLVIRADEGGAVPGKPYTWKSLLNAVLTLPKEAMGMPVVAMQPDGGGMGEVVGIDVPGNLPGLPADQVVLTVSM
jgi:hypothetical protein